jgi:hypothetical protein
MHESSTITITEHRPFANATVELLSDRPKSQCGHPWLKSFMFLDGQTIRMCPDCTKFDEHRRAVLGDTKRKSKMENYVPTFSEECVLTIEGGRMTESKAVSNTQLHENENLDTEFGDPKLMNDGDEGDESVEQNVVDLKRILSEARQRLAKIENALRHAG